MQTANSIHLSKSDFLLYLEAPRHLWARAHGQYQRQFSEFEQHLAGEGNRVEALGLQYLIDVLLRQSPGCDLFWQETFSDGPFFSRLDALIFKPNAQTFDLYEIKSSTSVDQDIIHDVGFQAAILEGRIPIDHYYVLHLNKDYVRRGGLSLPDLFVAADVSVKVRALLPDIRLLRQEALSMYTLSDPAQAAACLAPKDCPCPELCHPQLPEFSIYDIPRLSKDKKRQLLSMGVLAAADIPVGFPLTSKQELIAQCARRNDIHLNPAVLNAELSKCRFPLYFLDYETCIIAIPPYEGYHPQQQVVFQYSLHKIDYHGADALHVEHISLTPGDPTPALLARLSQDIGHEGTIIVWNKSFEMTRNREMAVLHPEFTPFLDDLNQRIYDLGEIVNQGHYLHPGFRGSWSIKRVLPVMVPELSYEGLSICKGDQASTAWWNIAFGQVSAEQEGELAEALLRYCELDTLAMVEIYRQLNALLN